MTTRPRRTYVVSEELLELLLGDVAAGAEPLVVMAELHEHATRYPDDECQPGPERHQLAE